MSQYKEELGFAPGDNPTPEEIKKKWKERCRECHPDLGGDVEKFRQVTHAYKMLTDEEYKFKNQDKPRSNFDLTIQFSLPFKSAFFGDTFLFNYAVVEFDENLKAVPREGLQVIEAIEIVIPKGTMEPTPIIRAGKGFKRGDMRGATTFIPVMEKHPKFAVERSRLMYGKGYHVVSNEEVPLVKMIKGSKIEVATMLGKRTVKIPPGSLPGSRVHIPGLGCGGGDHVVVLCPVFPDKDSLKGEDWKGVKIDWEEEKPLTNGLLDLDEQDLLQIYSKISQRR
jgi:DnaJ-class molecular chaperone